MYKILGRALDEKKIVMMMMKVGQLFDETSYIPPTYPTEIIGLDSKLIA